MAAMAVSGLAIMAASASPALATQSCGGEVGWADASFSGHVQAGEVYRHNALSLAFVLQPTPHGWQVQMLDRHGAEMPVFAAPIRPVETNPLNIAGWHFRNLANSGPNTGDVNAPQHLRRFAFGLAAATALDANTPPGLSVSGLGELQITDFTLTPPMPGERASMTSLEFSACLVWQGGGERLDPIALADPGVAFEKVVSGLIGCGLDTDIYKASDRMSKGREGGQNAYLEPDLDGDNIPDLVVPLTRRSDQAPGLAICLLGDETLILAGFNGRIGRHLEPVFFGRADYWAVHQGPVYQGADEGPPPALIGDALVFGKEDASSVLVYLNPALEVSSYWQGD